jgi:hypothetical protein
MGAAAAVIIRKQKELVAHFRSVGAVTPAKAQSPDALGVDTRIAWSSLKRRSVIREAEPGQFYLDEGAWDALRVRRRRLAKVMFVVVTLIGIVAVVVSVVVSRLAGRQ